MNQSAQKQLLKYLICVLLAGITFAAFAFVANCAFIAFDDRSYVVGNSHIQHGFSWAAIKWAFNAIYSNNWHPLTWLSHMLDWRLYGLDPAGPHLTNLAFHIANTLLLFLLLKNLTSKLWSAAFVALLFAIHPMHVESVAWISERKDVLSTFFFLLTLLAYARYVELAGAKKRMAWMVYGLALVLFALGLMAKPMLVTLPCILCLLDLWPLRRIQWPLASQPKGLLYRLLIEKIPFVLLAALSCWITFYVQNSTGAVKLAILESPAERFSHVPGSYAWYVFKLFWPVNLSVYYLLRNSNSAPEGFWGLLLLVAVTAYALLRARKYPWFLVGWFWFLGMLVPVIGFLQVGDQAYACRYTYLPYIGLFIMLAWGIPELLVKWPHHKTLLWAVSVLVAAACFWRTVVEVHYWKDGPTLFDRAIELDPQNEFAWMLRGAEFVNERDYDKAANYFTQSTKINDQFNLGWYHLGEALALEKKYAAALVAFQTALSCTWFNGDKAQIYNEIGDAYMATGQYGDAILNYQNSLDLSTGQSDVQDKLGSCFVQVGQLDQAATAYQNAISLDPDNADAYLGYAMLLGSTGRDSEAIVHYRKVIELDTNIVMALNNLAWSLSTNPDPSLRSGIEAVPLAEHACERTHYQQAFLIGTLAAAYAEAGRFQDAVVAAQKAHDVALAHGQKEIADSNARLMQLYKSGQPFHTGANSPPQKTSP